MIGLHNLGSGVHNEPALTHRIETYQQNYYAQEKPLTMSIMSRLPRPKIRRLSEKCEAIRPFEADEPRG
jgi:hypothetical protein